MILLFLFLVRLKIVCTNNLTHCAYLQDEKIIESFAEQDQFVKFRKEASFRIKKYLPAERRALVLGLVLGLNELYYFPDFREALRATGTIHVVVVSGFNISLVTGVLIKGIGSIYDRKIAGLIILATLFYSLLTGFNPPVVRAWLMSVSTIFTKSSGRIIEASYTLFLSALVMLLINPLYIFNLSFQLSFLATFGLTNYSNLIEKIFNFKSRSFLISDFTATFAAQLLVLPLIAFHFGELSLLGFIVNPLVLWSIPIMTVLGFVFVFFAFIFAPLAYVVSYFLLILSEIFINIIYFFANFSDLNLTIFIQKKELVFYYLFILLLPGFIPKKKAS